MRYVYTYHKVCSHLLFEWDFTTMNCVANITSYNYKTQSNSTQVIPLHLFFFIVVLCVETMTTSHTTRSAVAVRTSPRRNKVAGMKPTQRKNSGPRRSVNGKSSSRSTKPKALNHVRSDMNDVEHHRRTPPNITQTVSSEKKGKLSPMLSLMLKSIVLHQKRRLLCRRSQGLQKENK
jgi:hypothetical protein